MRDCLGSGAIQASIYVTLFQQFVIVRDKSSVLHRGKLFT